MLSTKKGAFYELKAKPNYPIQEVKSELTLKCPYNNDKLSIRFDRHLYITSDEEIKENSLVLLPNNTIHRMNASDMISYLDSQSKVTKRIIATTQPFMNLPKPSQQFIEKYIEEYNKGNVITDVLVEYNYELSCDEDEQGNLIPELYLRVNPKDNTITIKKVKDSYSREEVEKLIISCYKDLDKEWNWESHAQDFINENL